MKRDRDLEKTLHSNQKLIASCVDRENDLKYFDASSSIDMQGIALDWYRQQNMTSFIKTGI